MNRAAYAEGSRASCSFYSASRQLGANLAAYRPVRPNATACGAKRHRVANNQGDFQEGEDSYNGRLGGGLKHGLGFGASLLRHVRRRQDRGIEGHG